MRNFILGALALFGVEMLYTKAYEKGKEEAFTTAKKIALKTTNEKSKKSKNK